MPHTLLLPFLLACAFPLGSLATCKPSRPPPEQRKFASDAVDSIIVQVAAKMKDRELSCIFSNTLPNTLDTTVFAHDPINGENDTFILTGDIEAMWLRDSMNQVLPYMDLASKDASLLTLLRGLVRRQSEQILSDVYANAHNYAAWQANTPHAGDSTSKPSFLGTRVAAMNPMVFERKYELDSLCAFLKLSSTYHKSTNDTTPFTARWLSAVSLVLDTMVDMQSPTASYSGTYTFQRCDSCEPMDTLQHGIGWPAARTGMVRSCFRPSDDATVFPFNIPVNALAVVELSRAATLLDTLGAASLAQRARALVQDIDAGIKKYGVQTRDGGSVLVYEVDGFGNQLFMDDSNIPSLLSLPYLGYLAPTDPLYLRTRSAVLSTATNPYFFAGAAGNGTGGPHNGLGFIWPMGIAVRALTSTDDKEILMCLDMLKSASASTGFMHESFWQDNAGQYTRPWFAWANSLFGELILYLGATRPHLIFA